MTACCGAPVAAGGGFWPNEANVKARVQRQMISDVFISETKMVLPALFFYFEAVIPNERAESRAKLFIFFCLACQFDLATPTAFIVFTTNTNKARPVS